MIRLHHVNLVVPIGGPARVADFYTNVLGLVPIEKPTEGTTSGGAWFAIDAHTQLHLSERADATSHPDAHFAIVVDDFDAFLERLSRAGAPWKAQADLFGGRRGSTRDPLGNRIEVCEGRTHDPSSPSEEP